jgi:hypothetical protein
MEKFRVDILCGPLSEFEADFPRMFDEAVKEAANGASEDSDRRHPSAVLQNPHKFNGRNQTASSPWDSYGYNTPPTSVENSPVMSVAHGLSINGLPISPAVNACWSVDQQFDSSAHAALDTRTLNEHTFLSNYNRAWMHGPNDYSFDVDLPSYGSRGARDLDFELAFEQPSHHDFSPDCQLAMGVDAYMGSDASLDYLMAFPPLPRQEYAPSPPSNYTSYDCEFSDFMNWEPTPS